MNLLLFLARSIIAASAKVTQMGTDLEEAIVAIAEEGVKGLRDLEQRTQVAAQLKH
eukprot:SAG31_NODE_3663_length_4010_cov_4.327330_3_plen_56_part_00